MSKIVYLNGCTYSMEIDGTEFIDLSKEKQIELVRKLVEKVTDSGVLQNIAEEVLESIGEHSDFGYCEQCGSFNDQYTLSI